MYFKISSAYWRPYCLDFNVLQYIPRNMHTVFALLCFVVVIHWLIFPYPSGLLHWHCGNLTIAPVPAKQPWWIWINNSCEFIMNDYITTTKQSTTKPCAYFLGYTVTLTYNTCAVSYIHGSILRFRSQISTRLAVLNQSIVAYIVLYDLIILPHSMELWRRNYGVNVCSFSTCKPC